MGTDQLTGILRVILAAGGGFALSKGWVNADTLGWISGGALTIGPAVWSWITNRPASLAAKVQNMTGVNVQTTQAAAPDVKAAVEAAKAS